MRLFGKKGKQIELTVRGMTCGHCEMRVNKALTGIEGVAKAEASHEKEQAVITLEPKAEVYGGWARQGVRRSVQR